MFKSWYLIPGFLIFFIIFIIALASGVTWSHALIRGAGAGGLLGAAIVVLIEYINRLFAPYLEAAAGSEEEQVPTNEATFDLTVPAENPLDNGLETQSQQPVSTEAGDFKPLISQQQIDPEIEELIRQDPLRAAKIIEKMGLEN